MISIMFFKEMLPPGADSKGMGRHERFLRETFLVVCMTLLR